LWLEDKEGGVILKIRVQPRASKNELVGIQGDCLKIKVTSPPIEDRANEKLCEFLSHIMGVKKSGIEVIGGHKARVKRVMVAGCTPEEAKRKLMKS
jgi:uncharacterized protein (TIGR00251 family)